MLFLLVCSLRFFGCLMALQLLWPGYFEFNASSVSCRKTACESEGANACRSGACAFMSPKRFVQKHTTTMIIFAVYTYRRVCTILLPRYLSEGYFFRSFERPQMTCQVRLHEPLSIWAARCSALQNCTGSTATSSSRKINRYDQLSQGKWEKVEFQYGVKMETMQEAENLLMSLLITENSAETKEMSFHIIDLEQWEQRRCFHNLVRLSNAEDSVPLDTTVRAWWSILSKARTCPFQTHVGSSNLNQEICSSGVRLGDCLRQTWCKSCWCPEAAQYHCIHLHCISQCICPAEEYQESYDWQRCQPQRTSFPTFCGRRMGKWGAHESVGLLQKKPKAWAAVFSLLRASSFWVFVFWWDGFWCCFFWKAIDFRIAVEKPFLLL